MAKQTKNKSVYQETKQVGKFGAVGIINTVLDFALYNLLIALAGFPVIPANLVSTTFAMMFSFTANKAFVFHSKSSNLLRQAILFLVITMIGLYVIQNGVIYTLTNLWSWPLEFGYSIVILLGLADTFSREFVFNNGAKIIATVFSMTWNYLLYKKAVFKS